MTAERYNGWENYETWAVSLWLNNDQGSYGYWREAAQECMDDAEPTSYSTRREVAVRALADRMKDDCEERANEFLPDAGLFTDLLGAALSSVNWGEVAKGFMDEIEEPTDEDDDEEESTDE